MAVLKKITSKAIGIILISNILYLSILKADESQTKPAPNIIKEVGKPILVQWSDGREAQLEVTYVQNNYLPIEIAVFENTCGSKMKSPCNYNAGLSSVQFRWIWTKNPTNPSRIGQILEIKFPFIGEEDFKPYKALYQPTYLSHLKGSFLSEAVPADHFSCQNWDWLENYLPSTKPTLNSSIEPTIPLLINSWAAEIMFPNPETGENENRTFFNYNDVIFNFDKNKNTLTLDKVGDFVGLSDFVFYLVAGNVIHWELQSRTQQQCSLALKPNLEKINKTIGDINKSLDVLPSHVFLFTNDEQLEEVKLFGSDLLNFADYNKSPNEVR